MILTGNEDLRVKKTITGIKTAFEALICEKEYDRITVKELCDRAQVNKKTFYHYYETLDALLAELQLELSSAYLERIKHFKLPEELDKVNREFFLYSAEQGTAYEKITISGLYHAIRDEMIADVNDAGWGKENQPIVDLLKQYAEMKQATPAHISLAWMLHKYPNVVPIPGSKNKERIVENLSAANVELAEGEFNALEASLNQCRVYGHRGLGGF
ncbi:MAG: aldo/keto reductase [Oscillospiraceae bacterium]|nr:aldo/keto reductase [Oscillospiraceae bacterium]